MVKRNKKLHMMTTGGRHDGLQISRYRISINMRQEELGVLMDVTQQTVSNWEQTPQLDDELFAEIAAKMGIDPEKLRIFNPPTGTYYHIQEVKESAVISEMKDSAVCNVNPLQELLRAKEEIQNLYERLLEAEKEKNAALQWTNQSLQALLEKIK